MIDEILRKFLVYEMPGEKYEGPFAPLSEAERILKSSLRSHIKTLAEDIGPREILYSYSAYSRTCDYITSQLEQFGYNVEAQEFKVSGRTARNLVAQLVGTEDSLPPLVVGAHFDTVSPTVPGANDNGTGIASLLEIARLLKNEPPPDRSVIFVAFTNEEPPFFQSDDMGSMVYARSLKSRARSLLGMICLETIGFYSDDKGSQDIPDIILPVYKRIRGDDLRGNFIGFFSDLESAGFLKQAVLAFRNNCRFPSEGLASPIVPGLDLSDQWSFWQNGYRAIMVTDTAMMRYRPYHTPEDTPDKLTYEPYARVTMGLAEVVRALARSA